MFCGCCLCLTAFRLIVLNFLFQCVNSFFVIYGFFTNQWGIWEEDKNDCLSFYYLGLKHHRYGQTGSGCGTEWQVAEKVSCDDLQLNNNNCERFDQAQYAAYCAAVLAAASVLIKFINVLLLRCHTHQRILKLFIFVVGCADFCIVLLAMISCWQFKYMVEIGLPDTFVDLDDGYGWTLFLCGASFAVVLSLLSFVTLSRGVGENASVTKTATHDNL
jgi:hypothetical protein